MRLLFLFLTTFLLCSCNEEKKKKTVSVEQSYRTDSLNNTQKDSLSNRDVDIGFSNNGISVYELTRRIVNKYDQDNDRILDVNKDSFLRKDIESDAPGPDVMKTESRGLLFTNADKEGDANGLVSEKELYNYLSKFDEDGDGELTSGKSIFDFFGGDSEWEKFEAQHEERTKYEVKK